MSGSINNSIIGDPRSTPNSRASVSHTEDPVNPTINLRKRNGNLAQLKQVTQGGYRKRKLSRRRKNKKRNSRRSRLL